MKYTLFLGMMLAAAISAAAQEAPEGASNLPRLFSPKAEALKLQASSQQPKIDPVKITGDAIREVDTIVVARYSGLHQKHMMDIIAPPTAIPTYDYDFKPLEFLKGKPTNTVLVKFVEAGSVKGENPETRFKKDGKYLLLLKRSAAMDLQPVAGDSTIWYSLINPEAALYLEK